MRWSQDAQNDSVQPETFCIVAAAGRAGREGLAQWLRQADAETLLRSSNALSTVLRSWWIPYRDADKTASTRTAATAEVASPALASPAPAPPRPLSPAAHAAWQQALDTLRPHVLGEPPTYRLVLNVAKVHTRICYDPDDRTCPWPYKRLDFDDPAIARRAMVICYQETFVGISQLTPYVIERTAAGRFRRARAPERWPVDRATRLGFEALCFVAEATSSPR